MPRDLRILNENSWFLSEEQEYPIFYRYVICYSLLFYFNANNSREKGKKALEFLHDALIDGMMTIRNSDFLDLYPIEDGKIFLIIDQSNGIYPLVLYSDEVIREGHKGRVYAFQKSVEDILSNYDDIYEKLLTITFPDGWTEDFQKELRPLFTTSIDK